MSYILANDKGERHHKIYETERGALAAKRLTISNCEDILAWGLKPYSRRTPKYYKDKIKFFKTLNPIEVKI